MSQRVITTCQFCDFTTTDAAEALKHRREQQHPLRIRSAQPWDELRAVEEAQRLVFRKLLDFVYCDHTQETRADSQALVEILGVYAHLYHRMTILREECLR